MVSTERIMSYGRLPSEAPLDTIPATKKPSSSWPDKGCIHLECVQFRYAEHLPYVLKSITCDVQSCEKVKANFIMSVGMIPICTCFSRVTISGGK